MKKYESGSSGPGTIARNSGDWGGASYGTYQIATNTGTMKGFMNYLKSANPRIYNGLGRYSPGSSGFDQAWKALAKASPKEFEQLQHNFIKSTHYTPAATSIKNTVGLDVNKYSPALQEALWSISVQHGPAGAQRLFKNAGVKQGMSEKDIINRLYNERSKVDQYFSKSSANIKKSVYNRFQNERKDILALLDKHLG